MGRKAYKSGIINGMFGHGLLINKQARIFRVALKAISTFHSIYSAALSPAIPLFYFSLPGTGRPHLCCKH
jgi:hypothetical protein